MSYQNLIKIPRKAVTVSADDISFSANQILQVNNATNLPLVICSCSSPVALAPAFSMVKGHLPLLNIWLRRL